MSEYTLKQVKAEQVVPKELNPTVFGPGLEVDNSRKILTFVKEGTHENDVGSIQADQAIPILCRVYYYEMTIKCKGEKGKFVIGFADKKFNHGRMPGWDAGGFGYCGADGNKLTGQVVGQQFGPTYTEGDTVGAGIHLHRREVFFTKNSQYLGVAASIDSIKVIAELTPTVGLHSKLEQVEVNFGEQPFKFDLEGMIEEEMRVERELFEKKQVSSRELHLIIRDYLLFHGYQHTLEKLDGVCRLGQQLLDDVRQGWHEGLQIRSKVRRHILQDEVDTVVETLRNMGHVDIMTSNSSYNDVVFMLHIKKFLELCIKQCITDNGKSALMYAQKYLASFQSMEDFPPASRKLLEDSMTLLTYYPQIPQWLQYLVSPQFKDMMADAVNLSLLGVGDSANNSNQQQHLQSVLERILQYTIVVHAQMLKNNENIGEVFLLRDFMERHYPEMVKAEGDPNQALAPQQRPHILPAKKP